MKIFVGVKKSDLETVADALAEKVEFIIWPDDNKKQSSCVFPAMKKLLPEMVCYIHFSGYKKLTTNELSAFGDKCINLHPAPPKYPGIGGINFALYNNEKSFGVTIHLMNKHIDNGKILDVITFPIGEYKDLNEALCNLARKRLIILEDIVNDILLTSFDKYCDKHSQNKFTWSNKMWLRKELNANQTVLIDGSNDKHELARTVRAFHTDIFPVKLKIEKRLFSLVELSDDEI